MTTDPLKEIIANNDLDGFLSYLQNLTPEEQKKCFAGLCQQVNAAIDLRSMKIATVFQRKLKPGKTFDDFLAAWLPDGNSSSSKEQQQQQFFQYWQTFSENIKGAVFHAENLQEPDHILTLALINTEASEFHEVIAKAQEDEQQREDKIEQVTQPICPPAIYHLRYSIP